MRIAICAALIVMLGFLFALGNSDRSKIESQDVILTKI